MNLTTMDTKQQLKVILAAEYTSMSAVARMLTEKTGRKWYSQTIFTKLKKGTMRHEELKQIYDILGYDIIIQKRPGQKLGEIHNA